jgi:ATP-dependent Lhr-like helicase
MHLNEQIMGYFSSKGVLLNSFQNELLNKVDKKLQNVLIVAPTGIGKTLGASTIVINDWIQNSSDARKGKKKGKKTDQKYILWISPLKALSRNLMQQLESYWNDFILQNISNSNFPKRAVTDRTGDSSQKERREILTNPPLILCTTPESLFSMVVQKTTRNYIKQIKYLIIDELHSLAESKRGVLLSLTLELLERITVDKNLVRIGLSATVENLEWLGKFLVGPSREILLFRETRFERTPDLDIIIDKKEKSTVLPAFGYMGGWLAKRISKDVSLDRTILIFTKTRSATEKMAVGLKNHVSEELKLRIGAHHSSLSMEERFYVEKALKHGYLKAVSATASLELGIDIGVIDEVYLLSSPHSTNNALQRLGRARHNPEEKPKGKLFTTNLFDLLVAIALKRQIIDKRLSPVVPIEKPLEVLAQFIFGLGIQGDFTYIELRSLINNTYLFQDVSESELTATLEYCMFGGNSLKAYPDYSRLTLNNDVYSISSEQFRKLFFQNIGTIVEEDMIPVFSERGRKIGELEESTAMNLELGDIISIGGKSYLVKGYRNNQLVVSPNKGQPTIPRWGKTRLSLSTEVFQALKKLFIEIDDKKANLEDFWLTNLMKTAVNQLYTLQKVVTTWPLPHFLQFEFYNLKSLANDLLPVEKVVVSHRYLIIIYSFAGYKTNHSLSRLIAHRLQQYGIIQTRLHTDEIAFGIFSHTPFPEDETIWRKILSPEQAEQEFEIIVERSNAFRLAFRETAIIGQMVLKKYYQTKKTAKQLRLSHDLLFDVLVKYEPKHALLQAAREQVRNHFLHIHPALDWLQQYTTKEFVFKNLHIIPILSVPIILHGWIDYSAVTDPEDILESLFELVQSKQAY